MSLIDYFDKYLNLYLQVTYIKIIRYILYSKLSVIKINKYQKINNIFNNLYSNNLKLLLFLYIYKFINEYNNYIIYNIYYNSTINIFILKLLLYLITNYISFKFLHI